MKIKSLTIYCSASNKIDIKYFKMAKEVAELISNYDIKVETGQFQAFMNVSLVNDGPATLMVEIN